MQRYTFFAKQPNVWKEYIELVENFDQFLSFILIHLKDIPERKLVRVIPYRLVHFLSLDTIKCRHITIKQHILSSQLDDKILHITYLYDFIHIISPFLSAKIHNFRDNAK